MAGFFLLAQTINFVQNKYFNTPSKGGIRNSKARQASGIDNIGWYGSLVLTASCPSDMRKQFDVNMYEYFEYVSFKQIENNYKSELNK